jgi:vacuolar-type H+-ATPase subunit B/Vma2
MHIGQAGHCSRLEAYREEWQSMSIEVTLAQYRQKLDSEFQNYLADFESQLIRDGMTNRDSIEALLDREKGYFAEWRAERLIELEARLLRRARH